MNGVHLGHNLLAYNQMGTDITIDLGVMEDAFGLLLGVGKPVTTSVDGEDVVCKTHAAITGFNRRVVHRRVAGGGLLIVRSTLSSVTQLIEDAIGSRPRKPIVFEKSIDLTSGFGAHANLVVRNLVNLIQADSALLDNPLIRTNFDEILQSVLLSLPHNYRDEVFGESKPEMAPRMVHFAEEYIEANAAEALIPSRLLRRVVDLPTSADSLRCIGSALKNRPLIHCGWRDLPFADNRRAVSRALISHIAYCLLPGNRSMRVNRSRRVFLRNSAIALATTSLCRAQQAFSAKDKLTLPAANFSAAGFPPQEHCAQCVTAALASKRR